MDVFELRDRLVSDYEEFTRSFIKVRDPRIEDVVDRELSEGLLWPESLIQLNPSFAQGATIDELVGEGLLHDANRASASAETRPSSLERPESRHTGRIRSGCIR